MSARFLLGRHVAMLAFCLSVGAGGCRKRDTFAPVLLNGPSANAEVERGAAGVTWPPVLQATASNKAWLEWMVEKSATMVHIRVALPTLSHADEVSATAMACVATALADRMQQRALGQRMSSEVIHRPGRMELVLHAGKEQLDAALALVAQVLGERKPLRNLQAAKGRLASHIDANIVREQSNQAQALALDLPARHLVVTRQELNAIKDRELELAFATLSDPSRAWVLVHAPTPPDQHSAALSAFASTWKSRGLFTRQHGDAFERIRPQRKTTTHASQRLLDTSFQSFADPTARYATLVATVAVPLSTAQDGAYLRLLQRVLQESLDVRLTRSGGTALLTWKLEIPNQPAQAVQSFEAGLYTFSQATHAPIYEPHLRQSAQLWLGARMVRASLAEDDWTDLWSEAFDLSLPPASASGAAEATAASPSSVQQRSVIQQSALENEARAMQDVLAPALESAAKRLIDPWSARQPWTWILIGATPEVTAALEKAKKKYSAAPPPAPN